MNHLSKHSSEKERFSVVARARSFKYALRGMGIILRTQHNIWIQLSIGIFVSFLGVFFSISRTDWALLVLAMMAVLITESINTAIEIDIDLTSPEYHPYARDTKDVAAGAVLLAVIGATIIGLIVFLPKILAFI